MGRVSNWVLMGLYNVDTLIPGEAKAFTRIGGAIWEIDFPIP
jgi:hypothetical protein